MSRAEVILLFFSSFVFAFSVSSHTFFFSTKKQNTHSQ